MTLLSRVEALTGPDRDVDAELWADVAGIAVLYLDLQNSAPPLTGSVDAALAFAEKVLPGWAIEHIGADAVGFPGKLKTMGWYVDIGSGDAEPSRAGAPTLPLAILGAVLRAKEGT